MTPSEIVEDVYACWKACAAVAHLQALRPEMASYDCGSMNWMHSGLFINHPKFLEELGRNMQA